MFLPKNANHRLFLPASPYIVNDIRDAGTLFSELIHTPHSRLDPSLILIFFGSFVAVRNGFIQPRLFATRAYNLRFIPNIHDRTVFRIERHKCQNNAGNMLRGTGFGTSHGQPLNRRVRTIRPGEGNDVIKRFRRLDGKAEIRLYLRYED